MRRLLSVLASAALLASCVPPEKEENLGKRWDETTVMGELQQRGSIRIGVSIDSPTRLQDGQPGGYDSFTEEFALYLADTLKVEAEIIEVPSSQLATGIETGDIDIAFPLQVVTEQLVRQRSFTDPLLLTHQRLLVEADSGIEAIGDLAGEQVCAILDETGLDLSTVEPAIGLRTERDPAVCAAQLLRGEVAAVTGQDVVLTSLLTQIEEVCEEGSCAADYEVSGDQLTTGGLSALVVSGAQAWTDYVSLVLQKWKEDGGWEEAYTRTLGSESPSPPDLTIEEAAALYPRD
jgi:ABC-type amino acid transport substrate-binding protein